MTEMISWLANILAVIGWVINIKYRKYAMIVFTFATILSLIYFYSTNQTPFIYRFIIYLLIDFLTLLDVFKPKFLEQCLIHPVQSFAKHLRFHFHSFLQRIF